VFKGPVVVNRLLPLDLWGSGDEEQRSKSCLCSRTLSSAWEPSHILALSLPAVHLHGPVRLGGLQGCVPGLVFCHCDKTPDISNQKERFILAFGFQGFSLGSARSIALGPR
jgi:hypothetical protein